MNEVIKLPEATCGLGDCLIMMQNSAGKADVLYELPAKAAHLADLFRTFAPCVVEGSKKLDDNGQFTLNLADHELERACQRMPYPNRVALCLTCSATWRDERQFDLDLWTPLLSELSKAKTLIQFGLSQDGLAYPGAVQMRDLSIRDLMACYAVIGTYVGVDTGDLHLMRVLGGQCHAVIPEDKGGYRYSMWVDPFKSDRIRYYQKSEVIKILKQL